MKTNISQHIISEALYRFEQSNKDLILTEEFCGWNAWQLIKKPIYYSIRNDVFSFEKSIQPKKYKWILYLKSAFEYLWKIVLFLFFRRNALVLFTSDNYKLARDENSNWFDIFFDKYLIDFHEGKYVYIEASKNNVWKKDVAVKRDLKDVGKLLYLKVINYLFADKNEIKEVAKKYCVKINDFLISNGYAVEIKESVVVAILERFHAEYFFYKAVFRILNPKAVFFVDGIPYGGMAAAKFLKLKTFEFQHGFFIKDKPDYIVNGYMSKVLNKMVIPDYVLVFGEFFKDCMAKSNFWPNDSILPIGNYRVSDIRRRIFNKPSASKKVGSVELLFATQVTTFAHTQTFLSALLPNLPFDFSIKIKCHVREPLENLVWFKDLAQLYPNSITIEDPQTSLVSLMSVCDILVSYHSTAIFEALGLGIPVITVGTSEFPLGTNSLVNIPIGDVLKSASTPEDFAEIVSTYKQNTCYRETWRQACLAKANYFYAIDYEKSLARLNEMIS